jgi:group I intron endonuclease
MKKHGPENFKIEVIESCSSREELNKKEAYYISSLNSMAPNGYNLRPGGNVRSGVSEETRKLLSEKLSGSGNGMFGKKGSEKQRQWIIEYNKKPRSKDFIENCKKAQSLRASLGLNKGFTRKKTKEEIEKTRSKRLKTFKFLSPDGELFIIKDIHEFAKNNGFKARSLRKAYQFKKKYKGWTPVYD